MTITDAIERARALARKATPGPWEHEHDYADEGKHFVIKTGERFYCAVAECIIDDQQGESPQEQADADFIADARESYPRAIDALEEAVNEIEEAPHADGCANLEQGQLFGSCNCWKSRALAAIESKLRGEG